MKILLTISLWLFSFVSNAQLIVTKYDGAADSLISKTVSQNSFSWMILGANTQSLDDDAILGWEFDSEGNQLVSYHYTVLSNKQTASDIIYTTETDEGKIVKILFSLSEDIFVSVMDEDGYIIMRGNVTY